MTVWVNNNEVPENERVTLVWNSSTLKAKNLDTLNMGTKIEGYDRYKTFADEAALLLFVTSQGLNLVNEITDNA